jgi:hypothetical protein
MMKKNLLITFGILFIFCFGSLSFIFLSKQKIRLPFPKYNTNEIIVGKDIANINPVVEKNKLEKFNWDFDFQPTNTNHKINSLGKTKYVKNIILEFSSLSQQNDKYILGGEKFNRFSDFYDEQTQSLKYTIFIKFPENFTPEQKKFKLSYETLLVFEYQNLLDKNLTLSQNPDEFFGRYKKITDWLKTNQTVFTL